MSRKRGGSRLETKKRAKGGTSARRPFLKAFLITVVLGAAVLLAGAFVWFRFFFAVRPELPVLGAGDDLRELGGRAPEGVTDEDRKPDFFTVLILGLDSGVNNDAIMVASYDAANREAHLISIPRDTLVNVTRRVKKINAAYAAGTLNGGGADGGVAQARREIKTLIGFIPDYYVVVNFRAFERMIDAVGGVELDVPYAMRYHDPVQGLSINIPQGLQTLNGADALKFARYRMGGSGSRTISDYDRMANQQAVIKALLEKALRPSNITKLPEFIGIFSDNVRTDLTDGNLVWFGEQLAGLRGTDALSTHTLPMSGSSRAPHWYELADRDAALELINATVNPYTVPITPNDVDILTGVP
ncbi:MAG: LCP family protein [Oscillospiraceae bacterium]|nr:LCP family protein [Oscillospiraceae bacterium]